MKRAEWFPELREMPPWVQGILHAGAYALGLACLAKEQYNLVFQPETVALVTLPLAAGAVILSSRRKK